MSSNEIISIILVILIALPLGITFWLIAINLVVELISFLKNK